MWHVRNDINKEVKSQLRFFTQKRFALPPDKMSGETTSFNHTHYHPVVNDQHFICDQYMYTLHTRD